MLMHSTHGSSLALPASGFVRKWGASEGTKTWLIHYRTRARTPLVGHIFILLWESSSTYLRKGESSEPDVTGRDNIKIDPKTRRK